MYLYKVIADKEILLATHKSNKKIDYKATLRNFYKAYPMYSTIEIIYIGYQTNIDIFYMKGGHKI